MSMIEFPMMKRLRATGAENPVKASRNERTFKGHRGYSPQGGGDLNDGRSPR
jgi:hypothetical protein